MDRVYFDEFSWVKYNTAKYFKNGCPDIKLNKNWYVNKKEVKKVKKEIDYEKIKYWDVKVVKVKGRKQETKCEHSVIYYKPGMEGYRCCKCEKKVDSNGNDWGNFVNGENLDKIKFPCFCSFEDGMGYKHYGEMDYIPNNYGGGEYYRIRVLKQVKDYKKDIFCYSATSKNLEELIGTFKVKILKGKVVLFEKEEGE